MHREKYVGILSDEKFPRISLEYDFSGHGSARDAEEFGRRIRKQNPTIIGIEFVDHKTEYKKFFNDIAAGRRSPAEISFEDAGHPEFVRQLFWEIHNVKVPILLLDLPADAEFAKEARAAMVRFADFPREVAENAVPFDEALVQFADMMREYIESSRLREKHSMTILEETLAHLIATDERFKKLKNIKVAILYGAAHSAMAHEGRREYGDSEMHVHPSPFIFSPRDEMCRLLALGKEVPQPVLEHALIDHMTGTVVTQALTWLHLPQGDSKSMAIHRAIITSFTPEEIRTLYTQYSNKDTQKTAVTFLVARIVSVLKERGYQVPEEMGQFGILQK